MYWLDTRAYSSFEGKAPMTLLVGLRGHDGLVVAADSRGTFGDPRGLTAQNDSQKKLYITSKYSAVLLAGSGELGASLMEAVLKEIQGSEGVTPIMEKTRLVLRQKYAEMFSGFAIQQLPGLTIPVRPDVQLLLAGYDLDPSGKPTEQRIFQLLSQLDFAPMLHNYGFGLVGVAQYALYLLNRLYENGSSIEHLKALAAYVISETASQDGKVGGKIRLATITPKDGAVELSELDIERIIVENSIRNSSLKDSFFKIGEKKK
jgi:20S proteasome alpha/beta subunit